MNDPLDRAADFTPNRDIDAQVPLAAGDEKLILPVQDIALTEDEEDIRDARDAAGPARHFSDFCRTLGVQ